MSRGEPKSFALALGAGGARGLAHIAIVEALDEMGVKPVAIAGASIGAVIGAGYAAGLSGRTMRRHLITLAHDRGEVLRRVMAARAVAWSEILAAGFGNPFAVDASKFYDAFLGELLPDNFASLQIPLIAVTTDLHARAAVTFTEGPLKPAVSASIAVPGLVRPVELDGRVLVDGGTVDPLPFGCLRGKADVIVAVDVSGGVAARGVPDPWEALFSSISVMSHTIVSHKLKEGAPDLVLRPNIGIFRMLDFFQASAILRAAEPIKAELKARLSALL
ncbi:MAG TPA: patatin-like phospholipase family protein [Xanthobacteraceae bacterium]|nr:patatin-like phospholipase family protein [Xanthobacteraceae bacterium]